MNRREDALEYHRQGRPGKIAVVPTKPLTNQRDLALAYSPGVAEPCLEIKRDPAKAYAYTAKGTLIAVVTNGTAVLGLGNIGALAGKPVMEGKGILFKAFADIDVFDLEVGSEDPQDLIRFRQLLEPTVGGINLEDVRSPDCFIVERALRETLSIPVFHDDQHGTAIITGAALLNALEVVKKDIQDIRVVFAGAGAAAVASAKHYVRLGVARDRITLCDERGVRHADRDDLAEYRRQFASSGKARTLAEALKDADVFVGLSVGGIVRGEMLKAMAKRPIVFALANPTPEISPEEARQARSDAIIATGRSDYPNQVNNVLGFPFIFRGALDVRARKINEEMEMAATRALAALAKEEVPDSVTRAYGLDRLKFGPEYLIPKPFDPRVLLWVAPAVAWAAVGSGVAGRVIDVDEYRAQLDARLGRAREVMRGLSGRAQQAAHQRAPRDLRAGAVGAAAAQGDHAARSARAGARPHVPLAAHAPRRSSRRGGGRRGDVLPARHSPRAGGDRGRARTPPRERDLHAGAAAADLLFRRLYGDHRPGRGDAGRDRVGDGGFRAAPGNRAACRPALLP